MRKSLSTSTKNLRLRANVAVLLRRDDGRVWMGQCADRPDEWQFPQGGVSSGEDMRCAMFRELREETGVKRSLVTVVDQKGPYVYTFPNGRMKKGIYHGQSQTYFLCDFHGSDDDINVDHTCPEFSSFEWIKPKKFSLKRTPEFKHAVYRQVMSDFFGVKIKRWS